MIARKVFILFSAIFLFGHVAAAENTGRSVYVRPTEKSAPLIVIDPGHGGMDDLGGIGVGGIFEKDVALQISFYLEEFLQARLRAKTLLTRRTDIGMELERRTQFANDNQADLFISIHTNASPRRNAVGMETYYLDNTNDKASLRLAERENQGLRFPGTDLGFILSDLIQNAKLDESITLAHHIQNALVRTVGAVHSDVRDLGVKKAPFYVLVGAHMPCVLVETSFIDHPVEGRRLGERRYQRLLAEALFRGVKRYYESLRHVPSTSPSSKRL